MKSLKFKIPFESYRVGVGDGVMTLPLSLTEVSGLPRLGDRTYEAIREAILSGAFRPGAKLTVDHLVARLGVSRTPVKEALIRLEREGLVRIVPRHGAFVVRLTAADAADLYDLREVVEGLAARRAAERMDAAALSELDSLLEQSRACLGEPNYARYSHLDVAFHSAIAKASGSPPIQQVLESLRSQTRLLMATSVTLAGRLERSYAEHREIVEALRTGNAERAEQVARAHIRAVRDAVLEYLRGADGPTASAFPE